MLTVVCIKVGTKYGSEYVNKLQDMAQEHLTIPHRFICITDNPINLHCKTLPPEEETDGWWTKLTLFRKNPYGIEGKILFLDLDIIIRENINCFITNNDFQIIQDWYLPMFNSSVFLLEAGTRTEVWSTYIKDPIEAKRHATGGDQHWITQHAKAKTWPDEWIKSYKVNLFKEEGKIVVFHGKPKPHELDGWVKKAWG